MCRMSWNLGASVSWDPQGLSRPVMGLLYLFFTSYFRQYRHTCYPEHTPLSSSIVGYSSYIFQLNRCINSKWAVFGLCRYCIQWAMGRRPADGYQGYKETHFLYLNGLTHPSALSKQARLVINPELFKQSVCCQVTGTAMSANLKRFYFRIVTSQLTCETNMGHTAANTA